MIRTLFEERLFFESLLDLESEKLKIFLFFSLSVYTVCLVVGVTRSSMVNQKHRLSSL